MCGCRPPRLTGAFAARMKAPKLRWPFLLVGLVVGGFIGGELGLRYERSRTAKYDESLEDYYINGRIEGIIRSIRTIAIADQGDIGRIASSQNIWLRSEFVALVALHKSGRYPRKDEVIRKWLQSAKDFMAERPEEFINKDFVAMSSLVGQINSDAEGNDPESAKLTNQARNELQAAFGYVDNLGRSTANDSSEQGN